MNSNATQATAASSYTAGALIMVVVVWLLGLHGITMPDPVAGAFGTLLGYGIHWTAMFVIGRSGNGFVVAQPAVAESPSAAVSPPLTLSP